MEAHKTGTAPSVNPSGFTPLTFIANSTTVGVQGDYLTGVTSTGSQSAAWTIGSAYWGTIIAALSGASRQTITGTAHISDAAIILGVSNVRNTTQRTQLGVTNLRVTTQYVQLGITRVQVAGVQKTQNGVSRIQVAGNQKAQLGISRIQVATIQKTQLGISRIQVASNQKTQLGVIRIQIAGNQKVQTGVARIQVSGNQKVQYGVSNIRVTTVQNQIGLTRIQVAENQKGQNGVSNIRVTTQRAQLGTANLRVTTLQAQLGKSSVRNTTIQVQNGTFDIQATTQQTQVAVSRIQVTATPKIELGVSRIQISTQQTQLGTSRIKVLTYQNETGVSNIRNTTDQAQFGNSWINQRTLQIQAGGAFIFGQAPQSINSYNDTTSISVWNPADVTMYSNSTLIVGLGQAESTIESVTWNGISLVREAIAVNPGNVESTVWVLTTANANVLTSTTAPLVVTYQSSVTDKIVVVEVVAGLNPIVPVGDHSTAIGNNIFPAASVYTDSSHKYVFGMIAVDSSITTNPTQNVSSPFISQAWLGTTNLAGGAVAYGGAVADTLSVTSQISTAAPWAFSLVYLDYSPLQIQLGVSRIYNTTQQVQNGVSQIRVIHIRIQTGVTRINIYGTTVQFKFGTSAVLNTTEETQLGVTRIGYITQQTQTGTIRILASTFGQINASMWL